jgi:hypothetical protein
MRTSFAVVVAAAVVILSSVAGPLPVKDGQAQETAPAKPPNTTYGTWSKNVLLTPGSLSHNVQTEPHIAINSKGQMAVSWKEASTNDGAGQGVGWTYSDDGGATWGPLKDLPSSSSDTWLITDENDDFYEAEIHGDGADWVRHSTDGGHTWNSGTKATDTDSALADKETIGTDRKGCIYLIYDDKVSGVTRGSTSCDKAATWSATVPIADTAADIGGGVIEGNPSNGHIYAVFVRGSGSSMGIYFDKSTDKAKTWGTDVLISNTAAIVGRWKISLPDIAIDSSGNIYVAWTGYQNNQFDILFSSSSDEGATWSTPIKINDDTGSADQWQIQGGFIIDAKGTLQAAWRDERDGVYNQYYSNSTDGGKTWSKNIKISDQGFDIATFPRPGDYNGLAVAPNGTLYAVWVDGRDDGDSYTDIYFSYMLQGGGTPNKPPNVPTVTGPTSGYVNVSYTYNVTATDPDNDQVKYKIDWGDGKNDTTVLGASGWKGQMAHSWKLVGTYPVKAMTIDAKGAQSAWSSPLSVAISKQSVNHPPNPPTITGPASGKVGVSLTYDVVGSDPDNDQVKYTVDWGDGKSDTTPIGPSGWKSSPSHPWSAAGTYTVKAKTIDAKGLESGWSAPLTVTITQGTGSPPASPTINGPSGGLVNLELTYTFTSTDPDSDQVQFVIDWGDGNGDNTSLVASGSPATAKHTWTSVGNYTLKAKARDATGLESTWSSINVSIAAKDDKPPIIDHTPVTEAWEGDAITINAKITDDIGVNGATLYYRQKGAVNWTSFSMQGNSTQFSKTIPSRDVVEGTLEYYIQAEDYGKNKATSPATGASNPYEITVKSKPEVLPGVSDLTLLLILIISIAILSIILIFLLRKRKKKRQDETHNQSPSEARPRRKR